MNRPPDLTTCISAQNNAPSLGPGFARPQLSRPHQRQIRASRPLRRSPCIPAKQKAQSSSYTVFHEVCASCSANAGSALSRPLSPHMDRASGIPPTQQRRTGSHGMTAQTHHHQTRFGPQSQSRHTSYQLNLEQSAARKTTCLRKQSIPALSSKTPPADRPLATSAILNIVASQMCQLRHLRHHPLL